MKEANHFIKSLRYNKEALERNFHSTKISNITMVQRIQSLLDNIYPNYKKAESRLLEKLLQ